MQNKSFKIALATIMTLFNLLVCFFATYAWFFGAQYNNNASGITMQMDAHELKIDYNIYKYNDDLKQVEEVNNFELSPYDTVIKEKNDITPIVIKVILFGNVLENKTETDVSISAHCTETSATTDFLSNIIHFKFGVLDITSSEASDIYYQTLSGLADAEAHKFITTVKLTTIQCSITAPVSDSKITLYSILNYDEALVLAKGLSFDNAPAIANDIQYVRYGVHE